MPEAINWRRSLGGGETQPQIYECDDGEEWVLKLPGNRHGISGLCADWVGTALACLLGVPVVECSVVAVSDLALSTLPETASAREWARSGLAFGSRYMRDSEDVNSDNAPLDYFTAEERALLVVTDTWLDVLDRRKPDNQWNLLVLKSAGTRKLVAIDFGRALVAAIGPPLLGGPAMKAQIPDGWRAHMSNANIEAAVNSVQALARSQIVEIVNSVPSVWQAELPGFSRLTSYLDSRRSELLPCLMEGGGYAS